MSRYNLLHEPWIEVVDENNHQTKVSMLDIFENAHNYKRLSGETAPQDFAILRLLLAVLHTTFSRYKVDGFKQKNNKKAMRETWQQLWKLGKFPKIVIKYLKSQENKFYLYDDKYPFMQVTKQMMIDLNIDIDINKKGTVKGKLINRLLSESDNKVDLFAPTTEKFKNCLTNDQLARWLVALQGYAGSSGKVKFPGMKDTASIGWLASIGGVFLQDENFFRTLLLNLKLDDYKEQHPIWEKSLKQKIDLYKLTHPKDLSDLYTNCSRLIYINPESNFNKEEVKFKSVQLPAISDEAQYIEPMTLWQRPKSGSHKGEDIPKTHRPGESLWRSFSALSIVNDEEKSVRNTGILSWYDSDTVYEMIDNKMVKICAVGMPYKGKFSKILIGEYYDEVNINPQILFDNVPRGWDNRISDQVKLTKDTIYMSTKLAEFLCDIRNITNKMSKSFEEELYFSVDEPFKRWLAGIDKSTDKNDYIMYWHEKLYGILQRKSQDLITPITVRDLRGKINKKTLRIENSVVEYQRIMNIIKHKLGLNRGEK